MLGIHGTNAIKSGDDDDDEDGEILWRTFLNFTPELKLRLNLN